MIGKKYLLNGLGVLALGVFAVGCGDDDFFSDQDALNHANEIIGIDISPNQDWSMTSQATAIIAVNQDFGETYTVKVYANDPLVDKVGHVLTKGTIQNGETFTKVFDYASASKSLVVGITNSKGFTSYKRGVIANNQLVVKFGWIGSSARRAYKSMEEPSVPHITIPDDDYAKSFLEGAKEPDDQNVWDNHNDGYEIPGTEGHWVIDQQAGVTTDPVLPNFGWANDPVGMILYGWGNPSEDDRNFFNGTIKPLLDAYNNAPLEYDKGNKPKEYVETFNAKIDLFYAMYNALQNAGKTAWMNIWGQPVYGVLSEEVKHWEEGTASQWVEDETYVKKFKITGTYENLINVLSTEQAYGDARTVYISGTWTLSDLGYGQDGSPITEQRVGGGAVIVVDDGGVLDIPEGKIMTFVNQARLVVMPGGQVTGDGKLIVTNGNAEGLEGYNGGTIDIGTFNNNFGQFYNYGTFKCDNLEGGAGLSDFFNHGVAHIGSSGQAESWGGNYNTANTRVFNACQFYVDYDIRLRNLEMTSGSYLYVGGELAMIGSTDGTSDPSYASLASGALVRLGSLWNVNTSWVGPQSGYAVLEVGVIHSLDWTGEGPVTHGYFANNLAVTVDDKQFTQNGGLPVYDKLTNYVANGIGVNGNTEEVGNGGVVMVERYGASVTIPRDDDFEAGEAGCTPGYEGVPGGNPQDDEQEEEQEPDPDPTPEPNPDPTPEVNEPFSYAFEDSRRADYDMNDVVIKVKVNEENENKLDVTLCCTGASYNLYVYFNQAKLFGGQEVHAALGGTSGKFINTGSVDPGDPNSKFEKCDPVTVQIDKPEGFSFRDADFWVKSPEGEIHLATEGQDPHAVLIPFDWQWPIEWTCIKDAYSDFDEFANDATHETNSDWYNYGNPNYLYSE